MNLSNDCKIFIKSELLDIFKKKVFKKFKFKNLEEYKKYCNSSKEYYNIVNYNFHLLQDKDLINHYKKLMKFLNKINNLEVPKDLERLLKKINKKYNLKFYIVGGALRDLFLDLKNKDIDLVTNAKSYEELKNIFISYNIPIKETGKDFLVLRIKLNNNEYEISLFRKDRDNSGGKSGTLKDDAQRRDFTINSLYYNIVNKELLDPNKEALKDLFYRILKFIGKPKERIKEDPIRMLRFYSFLIRKDLIPDKKSLKEIRGNFNLFYNKMNPTRVLNEIEKFLEVKKIYEEKLNNNLFLKKENNNSINLF